MNINQDKVMKKVWALFESDKLIMKSKRKAELTALRDSEEGRKKKWYVALYIGRIVFSPVKLKKGE